ncbi:MAG: aminotransferase class V-fold PLP-dependent enzyme [Lewinellaceae bacterium]|nr:aminotransferase class V-fold PLP-dependent enzyme [Lewinellaceae bacterium]
MIDSDRLSHLRADTPGCAHRIHLNNAGSALPPSFVTQTIHHHLELEAQIGGYEAVDLTAAEIAAFYPAVARLLNADARNIAFAGSATDAYVKALSAIPFQKGDVILTTENDYVSNQIAFLSLQKRLGVRLVRASDTAEGGVDLDDFESLMKRHRPKLAAVTHVPTSSGLVQPVEAIGKICSAFETWYLVDACQSAGQLPLDVQAIQCDFLSATMRKFLRGPRGAGFLYASDRVLEAGLEMLMPDLHSAEWSGPDSYETADSARRFEYYEMPIALVLGSRAAVEYALSVGIEAVEQRVKHLANMTRRLLRELPDVQVLDLGAEQCGIVTAYSTHWQSRPLLEKLWAENINCRVSPPGVAQIDFPRKGVPWVLRISPHYYNTEEEIRYLAVVLGHAL